MPFERRVAPGKEYSLVRQVPLLHILLHDAVAIEYVLHVLDERNHPDTLGEEFAYPVLHGLAVEQGPVLLSDDDLSIVGLNQREFLG